MSARGQIRVDRQLRGGQAQLLEPTDLRDRERLVRHVRQRFAAKQRQRLARRPVPRLADLGRPSRLGDQPFETANVHELAVDPQLIPTPTRDDLRPADPGQRPAQSPDVVLDHVRGARRWLRTPQPLDQPVGRHRTIRLEPQHRQNGALLRVAERDGVAVNAGLDGSKDAEPHAAPVFGVARARPTQPHPRTPGKGSAGGRPHPARGRSTLYEAVSRRRVTRHRSRRRPSEVARVSAGRPHDRPGGHHVHRPTIYCSTIACVLLAFWMTGAAERGVAAGPALPRRTRRGGARGTFTSRDVSSPQMFTDRQRAVVTQLQALAVDPQAPREATSPSNRRSPRRSAPTTASTGATPALAPRACST